MLKEEKWYPKTFEEFYHKCANNKFSSRSDNKSVTVDDKFYWFRNEKESNAFRALGKLIQLRDWWWDNVCDGWKPDWTNIDENKWAIATEGTILGDKIITTMYWTNNRILVFPITEIRDKFFETYKDLIEEAKMFL